MTGESNVVPFRRKEEPERVAFEVTTDPLWSVRMALEVLCRVRDDLDSGDGYNRAREIHEGRHEGNMAYLEEAADDLRAFLRGREAEADHAP